MKRREKGKGKRERGRRLLLSFLFPLCLFTLVLSGCSKPPKRQAKDDKPRKEAKTPFDAVEIGPGDTVVYQSTDPESPPSFSLRWEGGGFDVVKGAVDTGNLKLPQGEIFQNGKPVSTYRADKGEAVRETKRLDMKGGVVLRSRDKAQTLKAPFAQYRGDVKLVRMTGGVTATGTFGTLSGVPELWATPDLRLIGTPDMVAKALKTPALLALAATAAVAYPHLQNGNDFDVQGGNAKVANLKTGGYQATIQAPKNGPTVVLIPSRGLAFRFSGTILLDIGSSGKGQIVRHMTTEGAVNVVQTSPTGRTTMEGTGAVYDAKPGAETADLTVGGRVTLVNSAKAANGAVNTTTSKGDKGSAVLVAKPSGSETGLRSATLTGSVTINSKGAGDDVFKGTGDRLVYVPKGDAADVDLTGGVVLTRVSRGKDGDGKPVTNTVVSRGARAHAVLEPNAGREENPLKSAVLEGGVDIDVSGSNGQSFKGSGDQIVYTASGEGGKAVMTGNLKFSGDAPGFLLSNADTATVVIGKEGWETVETSNSDGKPTTTTIKTPQKPKPSASAKGKKGGKP